MRYPQRDKDLRLVQRYWGIGRLYQEDADAGVHASSEWLLRQWKQEDKLKAFVGEWMTDKGKRVARLEQIRGELRKKASPVASAPGGRWYVNGQGQTMVVVPAPAKRWPGGSGRPQGSKAPPGLFIFAMVQLLGITKPKEHWRPPAGGAIIATECSGSNVCIL